MRKLGLIALSLVLLTPDARAQRGVADSLYLYDQDKQQVKFIQQNGAQLISSPVMHLNQANIAYNTANGHFRTSQVAENTSEAAFGTSGMTTLGRFKLYGELSFSKTWQDSLSWSLKGVPNDIQPYYFGAIKAGTWQRINYTLNTVVAYRLPGDHFYFAGGIHYFYNTAARSVDPRASVQTFNMLLTPELIYRNGKSTIGLSGHWGYEHEDNGISYRNIVFSTSQTYPDRILYRVFGYGSFAPAATNIRSLRRQGDIIGGGLNYAYQDSTKYWRGELTHRSHDEDDLFVIPGTARYDRYGTLFLKREDLSFIAGLTTEKFRYQINGGLSYDHAYDQNKTLNASSYKYRNLTAYASFSLQQKDRSAQQLEFAANVLYNDHLQRDLSVGHLFSYRYVQPGITAAIYRRFANADRLKFSISPALRLPLSDHLFIPPGELNVVFNNNVTYPDHAYYTATSGIVTGNVEFVTPRLFRSVYSGISANVVYNQPLNTGVVNQASAMRPSGNFMTGNFRFNIYF